jgi:hypothetical protein
VPRDVWVELDRRAFAELRVGRDIRADLEARTARVEASARRRCPVKSGALRDSIFSEVFEIERGLVGDVGAQEYYAPFVEFDVPFLRPALRSARTPAKRRPRRRKTA